MINVAIKEIQIDKKWKRMKGKEIKIKSFILINLTLNEDEDENKFTNWKYKKSIKK